LNLHKKDHLTALFESWAGEEHTSFHPLPPSASYREYYRISGATKTAIGVFNRDRKENEAFLSFTRHFLKKNLPVPNVYADDLQHGIYLLEDLGDLTLFKFLHENRVNGVFPDTATDRYKKSIETLIKFQVEASGDLDYSVCYPRASYDKQSMLWDMNYFKYYFLKLARIQFDEQLLEKDFHTFADYLLEEDCRYFIYRDFQARNIMLKDDKPYFIDYQGGRKGALQYDLASILFQAKANIPHQVRQELLDHYLDHLEKVIQVDREKFIQYFYSYVLIRQIQVLGAYGFRGFFERKTYFLDSIPFAIENLRWILSKISLPIEIPTLIDAFRQITESDALKKYGQQAGDNRFLTVKVSSFSYKQGIPVDPSGNGGGFVFDCRAIHNPGRYEPYKKLTGRDAEVITFLKTESNIDAFLSGVYGLVDNAVENYIERKFSHLMVSFGCTGGQHRSVYSADCLAQHLEKKYNVNVVLAHIEQERKGWIN
jgi:aminoglycoside/choline kinase family phosphotransferase